MKISDLELCVYKKNDLRPKLSKEIADEVFPTVGRANEVCYIYDVCR